MPRPKRIVVCLRCHRERPHFCKEMCQSCYGYERSQKAIGHCKQCNREKTGVYSGGVCGQCRTVNHQVKMGRVYKDKHAASERDRRQRLGDILRQKDRERNAHRRDWRTAYNASYYQRNKDQSKAQHQQWRKDNPGMRDLRKRRYMARKAGLESTLTRTQWEAIKEGFDHCCVYCNRQMHSLTQEHIIPVMHGGAYTEFNILPACQSCNSRKHSSTGYEFLIRIADEKRTNIRIPGPSRRR